MSKFEMLAATVASVATKGRKPKEIIAEVRKLHPKASKKDVVRAAFYALTIAPAVATGTEPDAPLYEFALSQRTLSDNDDSD
jgi:hypothetical protein